MNIKKEQKQDFISRSKNNKILLLCNNLYKPSIHILLYFHNKSKYKMVII